MLKKKIHISVKNHPVREKKTIACVTDFPKKLRKTYHVTNKKLLKLYLRLAVYFKTIKSCHARFLLTASIVLI